MNDPTSVKHQRLRELLLTVLLFSVVLGGLIWERGSDLRTDMLGVLGINSLYLKLGQEASSETEIEVAITPPEEFDFLTKDEVLAKRVASARQYPQLMRDHWLLGDYTPSHQVFGEIIDGKPWWGLEGIFYYGPGTDAIKGLSEESRFVLNPYLLVGIVEPTAFTSNKELPTGDYYPQATKLIYRPQQREVEVTYDLTGAVEYLEKIFPGTGNREWAWALLALNARDMGYKTLQRRSSSNVSWESKKSQTELNEFIHLGGSCGFVGGCNNLSPYKKEFNFRVNQFPARIAVILSESEESTEDDLTYLIRLDCWKSNGPGRLPDPCNPARGFRY